MAVKEKQNQKEKLNQNQKEKTNQREREKQNQSKFIISNLILVII